MCSLPKLKEFECAISEKDKQTCVMKLKVNTGEIIHLSNYFNYTYVRFGELYANIQIDDDDAIGPGVNAEGVKEKVFEVEVSKSELASAIEILQQARDQIGALVRPRTSQ